jgi:hypothetical protein
MPISRNGNGTWPKVDDFHGFMMFNGYINPHVQSFWSLLWSQLSQGLDNRWVAEFVCCFLGGSQSWETHNPRGERQGIWWEAARSAVDVFGGSVEVWNFRIRLIGGTLVPYKAIYCGDPEMASDLLKIGFVLVIRHESYITLWLTVP